MTPYVYIGAALAATVLIYGVVTYKRDRVYPIIRKGTTKAVLRVVS